MHRVYKKGGKFHRKKIKDHGNEKEKMEKVCFRCGHGGHFAKDPACPAKGQACRKCNGRDHFAKMCKSKGNDKKTVKCVETENQDRDYAFVMRDCSNTERVTFNVGGVELLM